MHSFAQRVAWLLLALPICPHAVAAEQASRSSVLNHLLEMYRDKDEYIYWFELSIDTDEIDRDFWFWHGKSDLYFQITIEDDPRPLFSPLYIRDASDTKYRVPFEAGLLMPGTRVTLNIRDDDSGGKIAEWLSMPSGAEIESTWGSSLEREASVAAMATTGVVAVASKAGLKKVDTQSRTVRGTLDYPQWLVQGHKSTIAADPIELAIPQHGRSTAPIDITHNGEIVGSAALVAANPSYNRTIIVIAYVLIFMILAIGAAALIRIRKRSAAS